MTDRCQELPDGDNNAASAVNNDMNNINVERDIKTPPRKKTLSLEENAEVGSLQTPQTKEIENNAKVVKIRAPKTAIGEITHT